MKKLFALLVCMLLLFTLVSCGDDSCQHRDADDNSLCDNCGESYTDGKDVEGSTPCSHRDADDNSLCDKCGESYTDGKDVEGSTPCSHRDADDNSLCDKCGESYTDGKDGNNNTTTDVNSITLNKNVVNIEVGDSESLTVSFNPENATDKNITWISSDSSIALVNNGVVVGVKVGTTTIIAMTANGKTATCLVNVSPKTYYAESVTLNKTSVDLPIGHTDTLTATVLPDYTTDKSVTWVSSAPSIVKVENGVITALSAGTATITAATSNGKTASCTVTALFIPVTDIIINESLIYVDAGDSITVNATAVPENATLTNLVWSSSNTNIATVSGGIITGVSDGIAVITVKTSDGTIEKSFNVVVENSAGILYTKSGSGYAVSGLAQATETVIIPDTYKGATVNEISIGAFGSECYSIRRLYLGQNIVNIPLGAFSNLRNLQELKIPNIDSSYLGYFFGASSYTYNREYVPPTLTDLVVLGGSIINDHAFNGCYGLVNIILPNSITNIGYAVFSGCNSLEKLTLPFIGESRKKNSENYQYPLGYFFGTDEYSGGVATKQSFYCSNLSSTTTITYYIPESLKYIEVTDGNILHGAFSDCKNLTNVKLENSVSSICDSAFYGCYNLEHITIPDNVTTIGDFAFYKCTKLKSIAFCDNVTKIGASAFYGCASLVSITLPNSITDIDNLAFFGCTNLISVTLGNNITHIAGDVFSDCPKIFEVINKSSLYVTKGSSEHGGVARSAVIIHNEESKIKNIDGYLFVSHNNANYLVGYCGISLELILPENYNGESYKIYANAFAYTAIKSVVVPDNVSSIGARAFLNCTKLESATIGNGVTRIANETFMNCYNLRSVIFGENLVGIGSIAFSDCKFTSIVLPASLSYISNAAFYDCKLCCVYFRGTSSQWSQVDKASQWNYSLSSNSQRYCEVVCDYVGE